MSNRPDLLNMINNCQLTDFYKNIQIFYVPTIDNRVQSIIKQKKFITQIDIDNFDYEFIGLADDVPDGCNPSVISIFNFLLIYKAEKLEPFFINIIKNNQIDLFISKENNFNHNEENFIKMIPLFFFREIVPKLKEDFVSKLLKKTIIPKNYLIELLKYYKSSPNMNKEIRNYIKLRPISEQKEYFPYFL